MVAEILLVRRLLDSMPEVKGGHRGKQRPPSPRALLILPFIRCACCCSLPPCLTSQPF